MSALEVISEIKKLPQVQRRKVYQFVSEQMRRAENRQDNKAANRALGHIKREHLSQAFLAVPLKELLDIADKVYQPPYTKQLTNERESITLAALRDTLLPKLLSGELRVKSAEKLVEA